MTDRIAIVGAGTTGFRATTPDVSYREVTYEAAVKAYEDAGIEPRDVDTFVTTAEDFCEGYSISDEYCPDQLGAVLRPIYTVPGDFIQTLGSAVMMIRSGVTDITVVQCLSKASNMLTKEELTTFAMDPAYQRPLRESSHFVAGLEMQRFLHETGTTRRQCASVVVKNRKNALDNPLAAHATVVDEEYVLESEVVSFPLTRMDISQYADGAVVLVLAKESTARALRGRPIWVRGIAWNSDTPGLETRSWGKLPYVRRACEKAYAMANIASPRSEVGFAEISDEFSYKELQTLEAMMLCNEGAAGQMTADGATRKDGSLPVNVSGGCLGCGNLLEANGGAKVYEVVTQLRGEAGRRQIPNVTTGVAESWRGVPTTTAAVVVLSN
jgi:acetyl-CoA C-acetyltransferase